MVEITKWETWQIIIFLVVNGVISYYVGVGINELYYKIKFSILKKHSIVE